MNDPEKQGLLFAIYQARGDEEAYYDEEDPEPEPSSDEDEDENAAKSRVQRSGPRRLNQPTSNKARRATVPQVAQAPLPVEARVHNDLKRKKYPATDVPSSSPKSGSVVLGFSPSRVGFAASRGRLSERRYCSGSDQPISAKVLPS